MYKIDIERNEIIELEERTFSELGLEERKHLQQWVRKHPTVFGEELLIIQHEFAGFSDTKERLDLLALDKQGSLVIIENKLDDSGKDVTWQALKYASYCSGLLKDDIRRMFQDYLDANEPGANAEEQMLEFLGAEDFDEITVNKGVTQRVILLARRFRKEVTSTILWLMNFKIRAQCFRAVPHSMGDELFLTFEQIIPTPDAEDYMIGMAEKAVDEIVTENKQKHRHVVRKKYWNALLSAMNAKTDLFLNVSPKTDSWIAAGSGFSGVTFNCIVLKTCVRAEVYISPSTKDKSKFVFDELQKNAATIESDFGGRLIWERLDDKIACRVKVEASGNVFEEERWDDMIAFTVDAMVRLEKAFKGPIKSAGEKLKAGT